jgi:hypothetical protein
LTDIAQLHLEAQISPYSFISGGFAYLEEDCDYAVYLEARAARGFAPPTIVQETVGHFARPSAHFGDAQFTPDFWDGLRRPA